MMPSGLKDNSIYVGAGDVLIKDLSVANAGYKPFGNCSDFSITPKVTEIEEKSCMADDWGNVISNLSMPDGVELAMTLTRYSKRLWQLALGGEIQALAQEAGTDVTVNLVLPQDEWVSVGKFNISDVSITEGSVVGIEGADFLVKKEAGMVMNLSGGNFTDGATLPVTFDHAASPADAYKILGAKVGSIEMGLMLDGINKYTGKRMIITIPKASFSNSDAVALITGQEKGSQSIKGKVVAVSGQAAFEAHFPDGE